MIYTQRSAIHASRDETDPGRYVMLTTRNNGKVIGFSL
jgi:hypothetical protein